MPNADLNRVLREHAARIGGDDPRTRHGGGGGGDETHNLKPSNAAAPRVSATGATTGDEGLFWQKDRLLGVVRGTQEVSITNDDGPRWFRIRTMRYAYEFICVGVAPTHHCRPRTEEAGREPPFLGEDDDQPGTPQYERWHLGNHLTITFEIEMSRTDELIVPARGEAVTSEYLRALEHQWRGAPVSTPTGTPAGNSEPS